MENRSWLDVFKKISDAVGEEVELGCPNCGNSGVRFAYVASEKDRIGYLDVWCDSCFHGVHFSRVRVPEGIRFINIEDQRLISHSIPEFQRVAPSGA